MMAVIDEDISPVEVRAHWMTWKRREKAHFKSRWMNE